MRRNTSGLRPRSAAFMRSIAASGGRASKGRPKTGRHRTSRRPQVALCDRLTPYDVLRARPAAGGVACAQGAGAWFLEPGEPVAMIRVTRPGRGMVAFW